MKLVDINVRRDIEHIAAIYANNALCLGFSAAEAVSLAHRQNANRPFAGVHDMLFDSLIVSACMSVGVY